MSVFSCTFVKYFQRLKRICPYILMILSIFVILSICNNIIQDSGEKISAKIQKYQIIHKQNDKNGTKIKYILQYHTTGNKTLCLNNKFNGCEFESCIFTRNFNMMPIEEFDAILFHEPQVNSNRLPPKYRKTFQKYIYFSHESPILFPIIFKENFYNLTITYRKHSDIYYPYANFVRRKYEFIRNETLFQEQVMEKTKLVAWVVSDCRSPGTHYRRKLYKELKKYINIDVFGACGTLSCPGRTSSECYEFLNKNYKFYLAFENSYCLDYLTEKLFNILNQTNIIPIVFGYNDYKHLLPIQSVINVDDFNNAKDLADYLLFLNKNPVSFMTYFDWKKYYWIKSDLVKEMCCDLCKKLHEPLHYSWYENMEEWSLGKRNSICPIYNIKWINQN